MYSPIVPLSQYKRSPESTEVGGVTAVTSKCGSAVAAPIAPAVSDEAQHQQPACGSPPTSMSPTQSAQLSNSKVKSRLGQMTSPEPSPQQSVSEERGIEDRYRLETSDSSKPLAALDVPTAAPGIIRSDSSVIGGVARSDRLLPPAPPPLCSRAVPLEVAIDLARASAEGHAGSGVAFGVDMSPQPASGQASRFEAAEQPVAAVVQLTDQQMAEGRVEQGRAEEGELPKVKEGGASRSAEPTCAIAKPAAGYEPAADAGKVELAAAVLTVLSGRCQIQYGDLVAPRRPAAPPLKAPTAKAASKKKRAAKAAAALDSVLPAAGMDQVKSDHQPSAVPEERSISASSRSNSVTSPAAAASGDVKGAELITASSPALLAATVPAVSRAAESVKALQALPAGRPAPKQTPAEGTTTSPPHCKAALEAAQAAKQEAADRETLIRRLNRQARLLTEAGALVPKPAYLQ